jgi:hypothetical protein
MWAEWVMTMLGTAGVFTLFVRKAQDANDGLPYFVPLKPKDDPYTGRALLISADPDGLMPMRDELNRRIFNAGHSEPTVEVVFLSFSDLLTRIVGHNRMAAKDTGLFEIGGLLKGQKGYLFTEGAYRAFQKSKGHPKATFRRLVADITSLRCTAPVWDIAWADVLQFAEGEAEKAAAFQEGIPLFRPPAEDSTLVM